MTYVSHHYVVFLIFITEKYSGKNGNLQVNLSYIYTETVSSFELNIKSCEHTPTSQLKKT